MGGDVSNVGCTTTVLRRMILRISYRVFMCSLLYWIAILTVVSDAYDPLQCYKHPKLKYTAFKDGCRPHAMHVSGCYGMCETMEVPTLSPPYKEPLHSTCNYDEFEFQTEQLPDCDPGVDPTYIYINAVSCVCSVPSYDTTSYYFRYFLPHNDKR